MTNLDVSYNKCIKVIRSSKTLEHLSASEKYLINFCNYYELNITDSLPSTLFEEFEKKVTEIFIAEQLF